MIKTFCITRNEIRRSINSWVSIKDLHKVFKFNQKAWLETYIYMNIELRKCC